MTTEFKVGDRVRRIRDDFAGIKVGDIGTIEEIKGSGFGGKTLVLKEYDFKNGFIYDNFELVEAAVTETFDTYDERMLPLFAKAAEEAERRGYCAEYDGIAAVVGAPSREEIRRLTAPVKTPKELAQEAFDAIPVGFTFHFTSQGEDFDRKHIKLSDSTFLYDYRTNYSPTVSDIGTFLKYGIEAN